MKYRTLALAFAVTALLPALSFAQAPQPVTPAAPAPPNVARDADRADIDAHCLRETGSRIRLRDRAPAARCHGFAAGRAYTREDLDRTGEVDIADALRRLDPAIY